MTLYNDTLNLEYQGTNEEWTRNKLLTFPKCPHCAKMSTYPNVSLLNTRPHFSKVSRLLKMSLLRNNVVCLHFLLDYVYTKLAAVNLKTCFSLSFKCAFLTQNIAILAKSGSRGNKSENRCLFVFFKV